MIFFTSAKLNNFRKHDFFLKTCMPQLFWPPCGRRLRCTRWPRTGPPTAAGAVGWRSAARAVAPGPWVHSVTPGGTFPGPHSWPEHTHCFFEPIHADPWGGGNDLSPSNTLKNITNLQWGGVTPALSEAMSRTRLWRNTSGPVSVGSSGGSWGRRRQQQLAMPPPAPVDTNDVCA